MAFLILFLILITISISIKFLLKRRIEEVIPISLVLITIIIYLGGLIDNLNIGVIIVEIISFISLIYNIFSFFKTIKNKSLKKELISIFTPGLFIYIIFYLICIYINRKRIFNDYDEYNHWGLILKNMFYYNGYGTVSNSRVTFNEYPPFTASFAYLLLNIKGKFLEDYALIAQDLLYLSFIIPITRKINFKMKFENLWKLLLSLVFIISPIIFYDAFFSNLLVDGLLGILFAIGLFIIYDDDNDKVYKNILFISIIIALCLTKTIGIFFGGILAIVKIINNLYYKDYKDLKFTLLLLLIPIILTSVWFFKINLSNKNTEWNFNDAINFEYHDKDKNEIIVSFKKAIFEKSDISYYKFSLFTWILILIIYSIYVYSNLTANNKKKYSYIMFFHSITIILFMIGLLWMYLTLFIEHEADILACWWRYTSIILISWVMLNNFILCNNKKNRIFPTFILIIIFLILYPYDIIKERYIERDNSVISIKESQKNFLTISKYKDKLSKNDKVYFVSKIMTPFVLKINKYKFFDINIANNDADLSCSYLDFTKTLIDENYDYVYIYRTYFGFEYNYNAIFENGEIYDESLYKVVIDENNEVKLVLVT